MWKTRDVLLTYLNHVNNTSLKSFAVNTQAPGSYRRVGRQLPVLVTCLGGCISDRRSAAQRLCGQRCVERRLAERGKGGEGGLGVGGNLGEVPPMSSANQPDPASFMNFSWGPLADMGIDAQESDSFQETMWKRASSRKSDG